MGASDHHGHRDVRLAFDLSMFLLFVLVVGFLAALLRFLRFSFDDFTKHIWRVFERGESVSNQTNGLWGNLEELCYDISFVIIGFGMCNVDELGSNQLRDIDRPERKRSYRRHMGDDS